MDAGSVPKRRAGVELEAVGDQAVMLDAQGTVARGLNATAARVWALIDGRRTVRQIAAAMEEDADLEQVERDVLGFLAELQSRQLID